MISYHMVSYDMISFGMEGRAGGRIGRADGRAVSPTGGRAGARAGRAKRTSKWPHLSQACILVCNITSEVYGVNSNMKDVSNLQSPRIS